MSLTAKDDSLVIDADMVGGTQPSPDTIDKDAACVGEIITNLRQLLKRGGLASIFGAGQYSGANILPFAWKYYATGSTVSQNLTPDPYGMFSSMYAIQRGGVRMRFMGTQPGLMYRVSLRQSMPSEVDRSEWFELNTIDHPTYINDSYNRPFAVNPSELGGIAVEIPYYHYTHSTPSLSQGIGEGLQPYSFSYLRGANSQSLQLYGGAIVDYSETDVYRSGSDDCNFGSFVSIPILNIIV